MTMTEDFMPVSSWGNCWACYRDGDYETVYFIARKENRMSPGNICEQCLREALKKITASKGVAVNHREIRIEE